MVARLIAAVILALTLGFVFLAPQGLLTNPTLEEGWIDSLLVAELGPAGPYQDVLADMDSLAVRREVGDIWPGVIYLGLKQEGPDRAIPALFVETGVEHGGAEAVREAVSAAYPSLDWRDWPGGDGLTVRFPYRGSFSHRFADWRVYDAISKELRRREWPGLRVLEIHDREAEEFRYLMRSPDESGE